MKTITIRLILRGLVARVSLSHIDLPLSIGHFTFIYRINDQSLAVDVNFHSEQDFQHTCYPIAVTHSTEMCRIQRQGFHLSTVVTVQP